MTEVIADKRDLPELLKRRGLGEIPDGISSFEGRHRAWVKVQDGCRQHCSYCIVPLVRPHLSSRPMPKCSTKSAVDIAVGQVSNLSIPHDRLETCPTGGFAEIVLTGIHLGHYGLEQPEPRIDLAGLVEKIIALPGEFRVRFSSIEAAEVTPELLRLMADRPDRICPHLHLPMQSGSDAILEKMKRRWPVGRFLDRCRGDSLAARPARSDDRCHRRFSRRNGGRFRRHLPRRRSRRASRKCMSSASVPGKARPPPSCPIACRNASINIGPPN